MLGDTSATERMVREWQERATELANGLLQNLHLAESARNRPRKSTSSSRASAGMRPKWTTWLTCSTRPWMQCTR